METKELIKKPRFSVAVMAVFILIFVSLGLYVVYRSFAATYVTIKFGQLTPTGGGFVKNVLSNGTMGTNVSCPGDCSGTYAYSTGYITYKAIPNPNYKFYRWRHGTSYYYTNPINISRTASQTWAVEFLPIPGTPEDLTYAKSLVDRYAGYCNILGATSTNAATKISFGTTPDNYQAVSYYTSGSIVLSPSHTASTPNIVAHEIYHIFDWRDNSKLDWGESVPPAPNPVCMPDTKLY